MRKKRGAARPKRESEKRRPDLHDHEIKQAHAWIDRELKSTATYRQQPPRRRPDAGDAYGMSVEVRRSHLEETPATHAFVVERGRSCWRTWGSRRDPLQPQHIPTRQIEYWRRRYTHSPPPSLSATDRATA